MLQVTMLNFFSYVPFDGSLNIEVLGQFQDSFLLKQSHD